jgi:serine protease AprX
VHPTLLTVGAVDEAGTGDRADDTVAAFSGRGPAPKGAAKPEVVAPGRSVVSLRAPGSVIDVATPGARVADSYFTGSGTSFSTAVTAGAAAVLLAEHELLPPQLKGLLITTAYTGPGLQELRAAGAGGVDLAAARALADSTPAPPQPTERSKPGQGAGTESSVAPHANSWSANSWSRANSWSANSWSRANSWSANSWSANSWSANSWSRAKSWSANSWSANSWSAQWWSANSWSANSWSANSWSANSWSANSWSAHSWGARG